MVIPAKNFIGKLTNKQIYDAAERYGYENYIPYGFIRDLFSVWTHIMFGNEPETAIIGETDYDISFKKLISLMSPERIKRSIGTEFAFNILNKYGPKLNLRNIENNRKTGLAFDFEEDKQYNYDFNLSNMSPKILSLVGVQLDAPINEIFISDELKDILKYYMGIRNFLGILEDKPRIDRRQMRNYAEIMKVPKRRLVYPTFKYDYITKNLPVKIPTVEKIDRDTLVLLIDVSASSVRNHKYVRLYKSLLLYLFENFKNNFNTLKIYYFSYSVNSYIEIKSSKQLSTLIYKPLTIGFGMKGWKNSIEYFKKTLHSSTIVMLTDGEKDAQALDLTKNNKYHIITLKDNSVLKNLARVTNGKFIKV